MADYTSVNNSGTACLLEALSTHPVECLVVASSMSLYGEGRYRNRAGDFVNVPERTVRQLKMGVWEVRDERGEPLTPVPTAEDKPPSLASIYALSKFDQERMCLIAGAAYEIPTVSLRLFNTYGPNQALSSPYTGVLSNFASRVLNDSAPVIYEDGLQKRDFVSVYDVARAFRLALKTPSAAGQCFNISSGQAVTVKEAAQLVLSSMGRTDIELVITGRYREGDIRHCFADTSLARKVLGWEPMMPVEEGLSDLAIWLAGQTSVDRAIEARAELAVRGLMV
jgi:dTDP-L-rhamnose 4-epimerase